MPTNFDPASIARTAGTTARTIGSGISAGLGLAANLGAALNNISDPQKLLSSLRSIGLPPGGNILGSFGGASASFSDGQDWRVRLSLPPGTFFDKSPVLKPLIDAGGLIFPYTPSITMSGAASYGDQSPVHQNFGFLHMKIQRLIRYLFKVHSIPKMAYRQRIGLLWYIFYGVLQKCFQDRVKMLVILL